MSMDIMMIAIPLYLSVWWMIFKVLNFNKTINFVEKICCEIRFFEEKRVQEYEEIRKRMAMIEHIIIRWNTERGIIQKFLGNGPHTSESIESICFTKDESYKEI